MKPRVVWCCLIVLISALLLAGAHSQEGMRVVDNSVFPNPQRKPSVFTHDMHNETAGIEDCNQCHHVYEDGELIEYDSSEDDRCADCHGLEDENGMPGLRKAFHLNCKGCHLKQAAGPIMCGECHRK